MRLVSTVTSARKPFAAICRTWPAPEVVVADRGLREGMLLRLMRAERPRRRAA